MYTYNILTLPDTNNSCYNKNYIPPGKIYINKIYFMHLHRTREKLLSLGQINFAFAKTNNNKKFICFKLI